MTLELAAPVQPGDAVTVTYAVPSTNPLQDEAGNAAAASDPAWRFVATGDFDGNGYDDILLRNVDTLASVYYAVTETGAERRPISLTKNPLYDFLGVGDFDGDGKDEILIRRNRDFGLWLYYDIEGRRATLRRDLGIGQNLDYEFAGIGDFNGDGRDDVMLRHRDVCSWVYYEMHPTERGTHRRPGITRNPLFTLHAVADITGDGRDDVMLRNTKSREWIYYAMTGPRALLQRPPGMTRNPRWTLHAIGDFDGSGRATPLIRLSVSGGWALYDIQGLDAQVVHFPGMSREQTWAAVGTLPAFHDGNPAQFSMIEFLQGPPTFRRDFRTGEIIGPVKASRPENDEEPVTEWQRIVGLTGQQAWSAANRGFVTSVWGRETVVAVEATHSYRAPAPQVEVELITAEGAIVALDVLLDITEPNVTGYRTELVFDLPRERNVPGTAVIARLHTEGATIEERQELFGETVEPVRVTWIPISTEDFAAPELDPEEYFATIRAAWPIAAYETRLGPEMRYEPTGNEEPDTVFDGVGEGGLYDQVILHHATHGCGDAEDYYGIYPNNAMGDARVETGGIAIGGFVMVGGDFPHEIHGIEPHELFEYPHEAGHQWGLSHTDCGGALGPDRRYPYPGASLGPARSWSLNGGFFVEPGAGYHDIMSYCSPQVASDYMYLKMAMYFQSSTRVQEVAPWQQCSVDDVGGPPTSLAASGLVYHDGQVTITGTAPSPLPPLGAPPVTEAEFWLTLEDAQGIRQHREPLALRPGHRDRPQVRGVWSARVPAPPAPRAATLRVESGDGAVVAAETFEYARR